jgi:hypothetical protein
VPGFQTQDQFRSNDQLPICAVSVTVVITKRGQIIVKVSARTWVVERGNKDITLVSMTSF